MKIVKQYFLQGLFIFSEFFKVIEVKLVIVCGNMHDVAFETLD